MEFLLAALPHTPVAWTLQILLSCAGAYVVLSFMEYYLHGGLLHRHALPAWMYRTFPALEQQWYEHAVVHHRTYYKVFNHESDPVGRALPLGIGWRTMLVGALLLAPLALALFFLIGLVPVVVLGISGILYVAAWNLVHTEMHIPQHPWWSTSRTFRFLARYHYLHHERSRKEENANINLVLPLVDACLGTLAEPEESERAAMRSMGYL